MKKKRRIAIIISAALVVLMVSLLCMSTALAVNVSSRRVTDMFDYNGGSGWKSLDTPEHYVAGSSPEQVAYCLQHSKSSPSNAAYNDSDILDSYSARVQTGLRIILENGYPYATGGLTAAAARYATANAIRFWLSENGESGQYNFTNLGAYSDAQLRSYAASGQIASKIRARSGYISVLQFSIELLIKARAQGLMPHDIALSAPSMSISGSYFVGTASVWLANMSGGYTLNTSGLPAGSSVSGYTGQSGDTLTIWIPLNEANAMTALVDPNNLVAESNESNNSKTVTISVNALRPDIEIVESTITDWYAGMEVTVSATVRNRTAQPVPSVTIRLTIGGTAYTESIPIAGNGSNLAVFRITVPKAGSYAVELAGDPNGALSETDEGNNSLTKNIQVLVVPASIVADPDNSEMEQRYDAYGLTNLPNAASSSYHTWQEVRLENGSYNTKTFYISLITAFSITPDSRIAYADYPRLMESGFGFSVQCTTTLITNYDHPEKLVGVQMVWVRYPESAYGLIAGWQNVKDSLEIKAGKAGDMTMTWQLAVNPHSATGSRLHYTPLWYPDGSYTAWAQAFYAWSPVGQLYEHKTDTLTIEGDMYDRITTIKR